MRLVKPLWIKIFLRIIIFIHYRTCLYLNVLEQSEKKKKIILQTFTFSEFLLAK